MGPQALSQRLGVVVEFTTMTRNATLAAGAVLLIAGVAAIAIIKNNPESSCVSSPLFLNSPLRTLWFGNRQD